MVAPALGFLSVSGVAARTVTLGHLFTPTPPSCQAGYTVLVTGVASGRSYVVPKAGVITSWSFHDGVNPVAGLKLKVGHSGGSGTYKIIGEATAGTQKANTVNTYKTHIAVKAGDLIGIYEDGGSCLSAGNARDTFVYSVGDVLAGTTVPFHRGAAKFPVSARVRLDCVVPNLKGKTLKAAKKALKAASCRLGKVRPKGHTGGKVKSQRPAAGKRLAPGAKVNIRLGERRRA